VPAISTLLLKNEIDDGMSICWGLDIRYPYCGGVRTKPWVRLNDTKGTSRLFRDQFSIPNNIQLEAPVWSFPLTETPGDTFGEPDLRTTKPNDQKATSQVCLVYLELEHHMVSHRSRANSTPLVRGMLQYHA
jgi:hypothetical protein